MDAQIACARRLFQGKARGTAACRKVVKPEKSR
jgi:hypothetical protein